MLINSVEKHIKLAGQNPASPPKRNFLFIFNFDLKGYLH